MFGLRQIRSFYTSSKLLRLPQRKNGSSAPNTVPIVLGEKVKWLIEARVLDLYAKTVKEDSGTNMITIIGLGAVIIYTAFVSSLVGILVYTKLGTTAEPSDVKVNNHHMKMDLKMDISKLETKIEKLKTKVDTLNAKLDAFIVGLTYLVKK